MVLQEKLSAIKVNLILLLRKAEKLALPEAADYRLINKVNELHQKLAEIEMILEEIEVIEEM